MRCHENAVVAMVISSHLWSGDQRGASFFHYWGAMDVGGILFFDVLVLLIH